MVHIHNHLSYIWVLFHYISTEYSRHNVKLDSYLKVIKEIHHLHHYLNSIYFDKLFLFSDCQIFLTMKEKSISQQIPKKQLMNVRS